MAKVKHESRWYPLESGESVLDGLLRQGVSVPHSCRAGACQSCLMKAVGGAVPQAAQVGLKETLVAQGYFLACTCRPPEGTELEVAGAEALRVPARISSLSFLAPDVLRVRLVTDAPFDYRAGQYVSLVREDGLARSYSLASLPREDALELHVRVIPGGAMSGWLAAEAPLDQRVFLQGPAGSCFYVAGRPDQPLLLAGTGTGLAPLYGIVRDALEAGHTGPIWLFHGARTPAGLYLRDELRQLADRHPQLRYRPGVLAGGTRDIAEGPLDALIRAECPKPVGWRAWLCGDPQLVLSLRKKLFLAGLSLKDLHADSFLPSTPQVGASPAAAGAR
ncbi:2Fe-2S iron-sulfur cluster binding domain-containing protein [Pyxidicoccus fallax]|uniref:2Fe-2S iron-sulfur cluster binding domain-containing protein n=1 Tax=Pyxidicoccus fallax TaxID=394095 RepID=A0A848LIP7_9BACT|nr:2Fe-2S iron-sulfur cluster-binding protein [Pyxidicoccus fallax]NMO17590.1 2Fe-2S iron-sulfur cluster binding domain-containing protein [Pyxidicoccus fallax]NPC84481.1 2Fe-2S iron-sulfur cluster binding domain-containing protein [Pyxidicoccus fallax]